MLCCLANSIEEIWYLHYSIKVNQGDIEEIWNGRTPMSTGHKLCKNDDSKEVDQTTHRSMIGKL